MQDNPEGMANTRRDAEGNPIVLGGSLTRSPSGELYTLQTFGVVDLITIQHLWSEIACLDNNQSTDPITDPQADAMLTVVAGEVVVYLDRKFKRFKQWGATVAPAGTEVVIKNASSEPAVILIVAAPPPTDD